MDRQFSATEVGALLESIRSDISIIAEKVDSLCIRMDRVENRLEKLEIEVRTIKDVIRIAIPDHERRISRLETKARF